ncbi:nuclear transport factor 2 family protein [Cyanobacteria bacterium FACHB-471]|nr:nuclear transport factor 2 family protein [Cyanobacteria bacterium FACHB-471]
MIHRLGQVLIGTGLMGLLAVPATTKAPTDQADSPSDGTVVLSTHDAVVCGDRCLMQLSLDRSSAIADVVQVRQSNPAGVQDTEMIEQRNKAIVQQYFDGWRNGDSNFFDLLAPEATWTITGTGATAGTYRKQAFLDQVVNPTSARLSTPIVPTVRGIWADGDMVIALWDGEATAGDGRPYRNTYTWYFRMQDGKAIEAIAFLDMQEFNDLWIRVSPRN